MAGKRYLMTPGPTPVPPRVLSAMAEPILHHRSPDFRQIYGEVLERLAAVCRTESDVLLFTSSGTGAFESAVANLTSPGERVLVVSAGYFGERWAQVVRAYGCDLVHVRYAWGEKPSTEDLTSKLEESGAALVLLTHSETSTGVVADVQALTATAKESGALVVVDAVSSLGAVPLEPDAWGIDSIVCGSQKALMTPPGLGFVTVSPEAWVKQERSTSPRFYFDWVKTRDGQRKLDSPATLAVSLVVGLNVALGMLLDEGLDAVFERHTALGRACREGVKAMGLELFSPDEDGSAVVTAVRAPEGVEADELVLALRDRFGIQIIGGQGELKGKIFRIGHIGYYDVFDITTVLAALELVLADAGADIERGVAVTRALEAFTATARV